MTPHEAAAVAELFGALTDPASGDVTAAVELLAEGANDALPGVVDIGRCVRATSTALDVLASELGELVPAGLRPRLTVASFEGERDA